MSKVAIEGNASGTGTFTIAAPNTNSNFTLTLPTETGTVLTSGGAIDVNASAPADSLTIDSSGNVGIGTTSIDNKVNIQESALSGRSASNGNTSVTIEHATDTGIQFFSADQVQLRFGDVASTGAGAIIYNHTSNYMNFNTAETERMRINSDGTLLIGKTATGASTNGAYFNPSGGGFFHLVVTNTTADSGQATLYLNRQSSDGVLVEFRQADIAEGNISVSGSTVSYNGGHLSRWAQMLTKPDLLKGTVMSNLDEMNVYVDADGNPVENEQLNKVKVSDVEGDANVAGVFVNWDYDEAHQVDEINMAMTGDMIIRIAQGVSVQRGDLLMSAGDGTAKPQGDDIVRSKTIAKVTSTHVTCTYDDGSYCVPCVLMAC
jgi:hypothetical protein